MSAYGTRVGEQSPDWISASAQFDVELLIRSALHAGDELRKSINAIPDFRGDGHKDHSFKRLFSERIGAARKKVLAIIPELERLLGPAGREVARCEANARRLSHGQAGICTAEISTNVNEACIAQNSELQRALAQLEQIVSVIAWLRGLLQRGAKRASWETEQI